MKRTIVSMCCHSASSDIHESALYAVASDGTAWSLGWNVSRGSYWEQLPALPDSEEAK